MGNNWFEKEEDALCEAYNKGEMTRAEFDKAMSELRRELRGAAEDAARDAYDREMGNW